MQEELKQKVYAAVAALLDDPATEISDDTRLLGDGSVLDSMRLVELCLSLEDTAAELGFEFDWTSESALSKSRSMFRTVGALAAEFIAQRSAQQ